MSNIMLASLGTQKTLGDDTSPLTAYKITRTVQLPFLQCTLLSHSLDLAVQYGGTECALMGIE